MALKQIISTKLEQRLSPQQIQLMKLLQVPTLELEQRIKQEIEENPALEEGLEISEDNYGENEEIGEDIDEKEFNVDDYLSDDSDYKTRINNSSKDNDDKAIPLSVDNSFQERLINQIQLLNFTDQEYIIADIIVGNLDESGYLNRSIEALVDDLAFSLNIIVTEQEVLEVLKIIQDLDPAGIGARDLQECLLLQINRKQDGNITRFTAKKILEQYFTEFTKKHYQKILDKLEISDQDLKEAIEEIVKLNPKPGGSTKESRGVYQQIIPDFEIVVNEGQLQLTINGRNAPDLKVSKQYQNMLRTYSEGAKSSKSEKEALTFVKQKLDSAKWFIDAIKQRQNTLFVTMNAIMNYQKDYFLSGDETQLRPMILKDIATIIDMDISTVSRVANSKYVQTSSGILSLKYFFSESLSTNSGEEVSTREVKKILSEAIDNEEKRKPLTDERLAKLLKEKGYNIARRTVAKYREQLKIPVARLRKEL
ncbi:MAG: RNA polymerase sigma-54 factor [Crocinitomicaceae bacterium]|nr:RNA polymerase sigma-54 factor [Crocinitomicaceae bacterium]|tara:strand:- start:31558 stop:32997 length:1440 start_codon:yes stop_codon:yes gene_type:complete